MYIVLIYRVLILFVTGDPTVSTIADIRHTPYFSPILLNINELVHVWNPKLFENIHSFVAIYMDLSRYTDNTI